VDARGADQQLGEIQVMTPETKCREGGRGAASLGSRSAPGRAATARGSVLLWGP
jgi:hypothetical protein